MGKNKVAIRAKHIKKSFRQYKKNMQKIRFLLLMREAGERTEVLNDISFEIKKGEKVGIIAHSLSGKSTLMRILARIIRPDSGKIQVNGEIVPILDYRLGFDNAMSGRDNYIRMSSALGRTTEEIKELEDSVFEFAKLSKVKDEPISSYEKGAATRLGFAIETAKKGDVVLLDGSLAFGSNHWNNACLDRLKDLISGDTTFVMIVNRIPFAAKLCDRGIVLHEGRVVFDGAYKDAAEYFNKNCKRLPHKQEVELPEEVPEEPKESNEEEKAETDEGSSDGSSM